MDQDLDDFGEDVFSPWRRADDDPVEDEHAWEVYLSNQPIARHFPIEFNSGTVIDAPRYSCGRCLRDLFDVRGRVRKTAAAAVIEASGMCVACNDVTGFDTRVRADGTIDRRYALGSQIFAPAIRGPQSCIERQGGEPVAERAQAHHRITQDHRLPDETPRPLLSRLICRVFHIRLLAEPQ